MSRWLSPEKATRRAARAAQDAAQRRKDKHRSWQMIGGVTVLSLGLMVADYFWLRHRARERHERRHPHHQNDTNTAPMQPNQ